MNGIFAIEKPTGITSAKFLSKIQRIFSDSNIFKKQHDQQKIIGSKESNANSKNILKENKKFKVKIGHGGTLDPLANGVLVVGVGTGTKQLGNYLTNCCKTYETKCLLGCATTTGDSSGEIILRTSFDHITKNLVEDTVKKFEGNLKQVPSIFSALKSDGIPLYEYARKGIKLEKPIKLRKVKINNIYVIKDDLLSKDHEFKTIELSDAEKNKTNFFSVENPTLNDTCLYFSDEYLEKTGTNPLNSNEINTRFPDPNEKLTQTLPMIHLITEVSSGTYIRNLIHDIGRALESSAYMVELTRLKQGEWDLKKNVFTLEHFTQNDESIWGPVLKKVLYNGSEIDVRNEINSLISDSFSK